MRLRDQAVQLATTQRLLVGGLAALLVLVGVGVLFARSGGDEADVAGSPAATSTTSEAIQPGSLATGAAGATPTPPAVPGGTVPPVGTTPLPPPADTASTSPAQPLATDPDSQATLPVGTCLVGTGQPSDVASVTPSTCDAEHTGEVFVSVILTQPADAPYPGRDALVEDSRLLCQGESYASYVGTPYAESRYFAYALLPTDTGWAAGDRDVSCVLYDIAGPMTGSARDSGL